MTLKNIVWLASYPKSGNTWTRAFLINYLLNTDQPVPINQIHRLGVGDSVTKTYDLVAGRKVDPNDYIAILKLRPKVLHSIAKNQADMNFVKTHNINTDAMGFQLIPPALTRSAIYIIRNPLDMVVSYARHYGLTIEKALEGVSREDNTTGVNQSVKQFLGNWSSHVTTWIDCKAFKVHMMRYEDMMETPEEIFAALIEDLGIPLDSARLKKAIRHSSFDELSGQEKQTEFIERSDNNEKFFHTGKTGQWREVMTQDQIDRFTQAHAPVMKRFGYLA